MRCVSGRTRISSHVTKTIFCLLDQEPVLADMISCDRYEPTEKD
jgi:hypothetical protein